MFEAEADGPAAMGSQVWAALFTHSMPCFPVLFPVWASLTTTHPCAGGHRVCECDET